MSKSILIAGIGNIFHGDDAFGVAVAQRLAAYAWPENVRVVDFGIRAVDLAFALLDGYDLTILVDATPRGGAPGTVYVIEPDLDSLREHAGEPCVNSHGLHPAQVLALARNMGAHFNRILVVGCEPRVLDSEDNDYIGLSRDVEAAVDPSIEIIRGLVQESNAEVAVFAEAGEGY